MRVVVIIVSFNGDKYIEKTLECLLYDPVVTKVIVIDNNSKDNSINIINRNKKVTLIALDENVGFGQANNIGLGESLKENFDYFFLLNQDVYVEKDTVSKLVQIHEKYPDYGIVAPIQLNGKGDKVDEKFYDYLFCQNKELGFSLLKNDLVSVYPVNFVNAAAWMISRNCLLTVGGFDPVFFHTGEDDDYVQRVKYWSYRVGIAPNVMVKHDRPQVAWLNSSTHESRQVTLNILNLKNIEEPIMHNIYRLLRKSMYYIIYNLLSLQFKAALIKSSSLIKALGMLPAIMKSREKSFSEFSFLKHYLVHRTAD